MAHLLTSICRVSSVNCSSVKKLRKTAPPLFDAPPTSQDDINAHQAVIAPSHNSLSILMYECATTLFEAPPVHNNIKQWFVRPICIRNEYNSLFEICFRQSWCRNMPLLFNTPPISHDTTKQSLLRQTRIGMRITACLKSVFVILDVGTCHFCSTRLL